MIVDSSISSTIQKWDKSNSNEHSILQMISEPLIYSVIKLKIDTALMKLHSYKTTNSSTIPISFTIPYKVSWWEIIKQIYFQYLEAQLSFFNFKTAFGQQTHIYVSVFLFIKGHLYMMGAWLQYKAASFLRKLDIKCFILETEVHL